MFQAYFFGPNENLSNFWLAAIRCFFEIQDIESSYDDVDFLIIRMMLKPIIVDTTISHYNWLELIKEEYKVCYLRYFVGAAQDCSLAKAHWLRTFGS